MFLITTTIVAFLKQEVEYYDKSHEVAHERDIKTAYTSLKKILELRSVQTLVLILLTCKVCQINLLVIGRFIGVF